MDVKLLALTGPTTMKEEAIKEIIANLANDFLKVRLRPTFRERSDFIPDKNIEDRRDVTMPTVMGFGASTAETYPNRFGR